MTVAEGTRSRTNAFESEQNRQYHPAESEGTGLMFQEILRKLESFNTRLTAMEESSLMQSSKNTMIEGEEREETERILRRTDYQADRITRQTKIEFPVFDGSRVQDWIFKSERFFELDSTPAELKVSLASVYLVGLAMDWHYAFIQNRKLVGPVSWEEYALAMSMRFGPSDLQRPIAQLKRLKEGSSFFEYVDAFVFLVSKVELSDDDQVAMFIEGLRSDNQKLITILGPKNLQQAIAFAKTLSTEVDPYGNKKMEGVGDFCRPGNWQGVKNIQSHSIPMQQMGKSHMQRVQNLPKQYSATGSRSVPYQPPHRRVSPMEMEDRRSKGLCFWCDDKYTFGHKCANKRLFTLVLEPEDKEVLEVEEEEMVEENQDNPVVTLHALHGVGSPAINQTMKLVGFYKKRRLSILVDSGSTHNFLDAQVAKRMGCASQSIGDQRVLVANGDQLRCNSQCRDFEWVMQGTHFIANVLIMPIKGCELILGMEWLKSLGVVKWDFPMMKMEFPWKGNQVVLQATEIKYSPMKEGKLDSCKDRMGLFIIQGKQEQQVNSNLSDQTIPREILILLEDFQHLFEEPKTLPPHRDQDHCIPLEAGVKGVNVRPYRHSSTQKDIIEGMVREMLQGGLIQPSNSSFSSPVVLVRKKDNSWRMCVDYRELNNKTIKDKYPIPGPELMAVTLTLKGGTLLDDIKRSWQEDSQLRVEIQHLEAGKESKLTWKSGLLLRKGKLVVGSNRLLRTSIVHTFHSSSAGGHSGVHATTKRISGFCYWKGLERDVRNYCRRRQRLGEVLR